jgi:hypothetical protein
MSEDKIFSGQMLTTLLLLQHGEHLATYQKKLPLMAGVA